VNFRRDEEEEDSVGGGEDEAGEEERGEDEDVVADVAGSVFWLRLSVFHHSSNDQHRNTGHSPS